MPTIFILFGFHFMFYSDDHEPIHVHIIKDGKEAKYNLLPEISLVYNHGYKNADWQVLRSATPEQRADFTLSYCGIHWPALNEDLSFEGMFETAGICPRGVDRCNVIYSE